MSEETTVAAPEAPIVTDAPAPETAPAVTPESTEPVAPTKPMTRQEARRASAEAGKALAEKRAAAEASRDKALEQPRVEAGTPEGGEFKKVEGEPAGEPAVETPADAQAPAKPVAAAAGASAATPDESAVAETPAPELVTIPLPEGHPWRDRGETEVRTTPDQERQMRAAINAADRIRGMDTLEQTNALLEARLRALESDDLPAQYQTDPKLVHLLNEIAEKYDPETRALIESGLDALQQQHVNQYEQGAMADVQRRGIASNFITQTLEAAASMVPVWVESGETQYRLAPLMQEYGNLVDGRNQLLVQQGKRETPPTTQEFYRWIAQSYMSDPRARAKMDAQAQVRREAETERIRAEEREALETAEAAKLQETADRHATRPPSPAARTPTQATPASKETPPVPVDIARQPNRRKAIRDSIRQDYANR